MEKTEIIIHTKLTIGVSACCMGSPVRYNGKGWDLLKNLGREKNDFRWCPVCPECMAGLGVLREPIRLSGGDGTKVWTGDAEVKNRKGEIVTNKVIEGALACIEALSRAGAIAYVYMDGSPSCGVYRTTLKNTNRGNPPGVFGAKLLELGFFLIPASDLQSPLKWWDWRRRLLAFYWLKNVPLDSKNQLYEAWYKTKFLCRELNQEWTQNIGRNLALIVEEDVKEFGDRFRKEALDLLRKPSNTKKITNSLWAQYSYYKKLQGKSIEEINAPEIKRNVTSIAKELLLMERKAHEDKVFFGTSPVLYRDKRSN
ncbi:DUF523 domain-containing protein [Mobilitalea sibirica]|uniref:DUF523 domain-containing protein n=1 Tax=Mobilitalea sibirica TaxID=1462919 RepID=A0A8J7KRS7_9FIRM|nr:DUF523 domain-containing protein [Mobilitalea sibirica]MBH1939591.1 DUF523 domain-containing protein [Mobilitalea sibirica]